MNNYSILLDIITILIAVIIVISSYRKGFLYSVTTLIGYIASIFIAIWASRRLSVFVYEHFIHDAIIKNIEQTIAQSSQGMSFAAVLSSVFSKLPQVIVAPIFAGFGGKEELVTKLQENTGGMISKLSTTISETIAAPIIQALLQMFFCLLIFAVCVIIVKMISSLLKGFHAFPILGSINSVLGVGFGILKAGIIIYVLAIAVSLFISLTANHFSWLNINVIYKSHVFKEFYKFAIK